MSGFQDSMNKQRQMGYLSAAILVVLLLLSVIVYLALHANRNGKIALNATSATWISSGEMVTKRLQKMSLLHGRWEEFLATPGAQDAAIARDAKAFEVAERLRALADRSVKSVVDAMAEVKVKWERGMLSPQGVQEEVELVLSAAISVSSIVQGAVDALAVAQGKPIVGLPSAPPANP